jgi:motA/tolQ/exbB proton channel family protein
MTYISDFLFWISTGLLVPVIILLLVLFGRALLLLGTFFGQYMNMRKLHGTVIVEMENLTVDNVSSLSTRLPVQTSSLLLSYIHRMLNAQGCHAQINRLLSQYEIAADKEMGISKTLSKLGPVLGLMGTLIPMGPALVGLSTGDIASMAYNMQVAFATTVVGLFSGAVGVVTLQVKKRWHMQELTQLEFLAELLTSENPAHETA